MTRDEGFAVMDVSTSLLHDPKVRRLQRNVPEHWAVAMIAYVSTMAESWKAGRRVSVDDAWPIGLAYDATAIDGLRQVGLLDAQGLIVPRTWRSWFGKAKTSREKTRADWRRWQENHRRNKGGVMPDSDPDKGNPSGLSGSPGLPGSTGAPGSPPRAAREAKDDGLKAPPTKEETLRWLSDEFQAGRLDEMEYRRQRKALGAA